MSVAKRPRLEGSFSPASPPYHLAKGIEQTSRTGGFQQPQTPTSPPAQSMSMSSALTNVSAASTVNTQFTDDTPSSSVAGNGSLAKDGQDTASTSVKRDQVPNAASGSHSHARTDHERIQDGLDVVGGDHQEELRDYLLSVDVGPLYNLSDKAYARSNPHPSQDLIALFSLQDIAASVQRKDPRTGEKINKLRKSYEGKIKELGVAGRNKAVDGEGDFETLMAWPAEEWHNQRVHGKEISKGMGGDFEKRLEAALHMAAPQARLSDAESDRWRALIAIEEPAKTRQSSTSQLPQEPPTSTPAQSVSSRPTAHGALRPERSGKKRRYNDASFTGYGEGFLDDQLDLSDDEDDKALMRRKRMKS